MAIIVGLVCLDLDKVRPVRQHSKPSDWESLRLTVRRRLTKLGLQFWSDESGKVIIHRTFRNERTHFLLKFCEIPDHQQYSLWRRFVYWFAWQYRMLQLPAIANWIVGSLLVISSFIYLDDIAIAVSASECPIDKKCTWGVLPLGGSVPNLIQFGIFGATIALAVFFALMSHWIDDLSETCNKYLVELDERKRRADVKSLGDKDSSLADFLKALEAGVEIDGSVASIDPQQNEIATDSGTFTFAANIDISTIKVGDIVRITLELRDGQPVATAIHRLT
jgi:hypothetical protein